MASLRWQEERFLTQGLPTFNATYHRHPQTWSVSLFRFGTPSGSLGYDKVIISLR